MHVCIHACLPASLPACYSPQIHVYVDLANVILFGNTVFVHVIKIKSYWVRADPNSMTGVLIRGRQTQREDGHMKIEGEIGVMLPQTKEWQRLLTTTRILKRKKSFFHRAFRESMVFPTPWFGLLASGKNKFLLFKAIQFVVFVMAALGNQYTVLLSSSVSNKKTEAPNGRTLGDLA